MYDRKLQVKSIKYSIYRTMLQGTLGIKVFYVKYAFRISYSNNYTFF